MKKLVSFSMFAAMVILALIAWGTATAKPMGIHGLVNISNMKQ